MKIMKKICSLLLVIAMLGALLSGCGQDAKTEEPTEGTAQATANQYENTTNTLFLYPINYYGIEGKAFTSRWNGMRDALVNAGWEITGDGQKDSTQFKVTRTDKCTMPEDTAVVFVNNQTWDTTLALTNNLTKHTPLAVISTCNGVEFCSEKIIAYSEGTQNVTYASFSKVYEEAFQDGSLNYMASKYTASIAPIVAALYSAVTTGERMENDQGEALHMEQQFWTIQSLEEYQAWSGYDVITGAHPTIMKANMDEALAQADPAARYAALSDFAANHTTNQEQVKALFEANQSLTDTKADTEEFTVGLLIPNSVNESVQAYIDFISGYLAEVYNYKTYEVKVDGSSTNQETAADKAINAGCKAIISLQDDTDRVAACQLASKKGVWFAIAGSCVYGTEEWNQLNSCDHYVGSVGTSLDAEYQAGFDMVQHYIDIINERGVVK